jgi:RNA polymerase sigma-70 factor (ECF subfamily)
MIPDLIDAPMTAQPAFGEQPSWNGRVNNDSTCVGGICGQAPRDRDAELMLRVRDGDPASFGLLLEKHRPPVLHYLCRMVQNEAVAEELTQDVFLRVYKSRGNYEATAKFTTWVFRIATHLALNWIRDGRSEKSQTSLDGGTANGASRQVPDRHRTAEQELVHQAKLREVREAIDGLPAKQRAAVMMHKYREMEYTQIAGAIGCSESAVRSLLFRAYEALRARLAHMA